jgi:hypothetical protein
MLSKELLERFKRGEVVFHTPTQEIFDKAIKDVGWFRCRWYGNRAAFEEYESETGIDYENGYKVTFDSIDTYRSDYPQLEIITLKLSDFDSKTKEVTQVIPLDIQSRLIVITRAIDYYGKLEKTYDTDLELDGLYTAREEILRELEDSLEIHI